MNKIIQTQLPPKGKGDARSNGKVGGSGGRAFCDTRRGMSRPGQRWSLRDGRWWPPWGGPARRITVTVDTDSWNGGVVW